MSRFNKMAKEVMKKMEPQVEKFIVAFIKVLVHVVFQNVVKARKASR